MYINRSPPRPKCTFARGYSLSWPLGSLVGGGRMCGKRKEQSLPQISGRFTGLIAQEWGAGGWEPMRKESWEIIYSRKRGATRVQEVHKYKGKCLCLPLAPLSLHPIYAPSTQTAATCKNGQAREDEARQSRTKRKTKKGDALAEIKERSFHANLTNLITNYLPTHLTRSLPGEHTIFGSKNV